MATATYNIPTMPFFLQKKPGDGDPIVYSAADFRRYTGAVIRRTGVLGSSHFVVGQAPNVGWKIYVNSGYAHVGGAGFDYLVHMQNDQEISLTGFTTSPASKRTHKVFVAVFDALSAGTGYESRIVVTEDVGTGAPDPAGAVAFLPLATFTISPGQANIQNSHIKNSARHGGASGEYVMMSTSPYLDMSQYLDASSLMDTAFYRAIYHDGYVRLGGAIGRSNGYAFESGKDYVTGIMHSNFRPNNTRYLLASWSINEIHTTSSGSYVCRLRIDPDGTMTVRMPTGNTPMYVVFDGVTYDLD